MKMIDIVNEDNDVEEGRLKKSLKRKAKRAGKASGKRKKSGIGETSSSGGQAQEMDLLPVESVQSLELE